MKTVHFPHSAITRQNNNKQKRKISKLDDNEMFTTYMTH